MIQVSDKWKSAHAGYVVPEAFVRITYGVTEPGWQALAEVVNTPVKEHSNPTEITTATGVRRTKYATLEPNMWLLDGTFDVLEDTEPKEGAGFISAYAADENGEMPMGSTGVGIRFDTIRTRAIPGVMITWSSTYNEYATRFRIFAANNETILVDKEFENDSVTTMCDIALSGYTGIVIEVLAWSVPGHSPRIEQVSLGQTQTYTKTDLLGYMHSQSGDLLSGELPKNSITFSLNNVDGLWNPDNPTGNAIYLIERQEINVEYGYKLGDEMEWVNAGTFWSTDWETAANGLEAKFSARDALCFMSETYHGIRSGTLYDIALAAFEQSNIPTINNTTPRYVVSQALAQYRTDFSDDASEYSCAEIVQLCANAARCVFYQDRSGILRVEQVKESATDYTIRKFTSYTHPEFVLMKQLRSVSVNNGLGSASHAATGEVQTVENVMIKNSSHASSVAEWIRKNLEHRKTLSGEYRADPRLDVFDKIAVESKYGVNNAVYVTEIEYTYNGSFKGKYVGRVTGFDTEKWYSGELFSGEV